MNKPIIAFDADDVLLDTVSKWIKRYNHYYEDTLTSNDIKTWDIASYTKLKDVPQKFYNLLDDFLYKGVEAIDGSLLGFQRARKYGRVIVVTSNFGDIGKPKFNALNRLGFEIEKKDFYECVDKSLICYDILFDDNIENVRSAYGGNGCLFQQPWNLADDFPNRVSNWNDVNNMIEEMFGNE